MRISFISVIHKGLGVLSSRGDYESGGMKDLGFDWLGWGRLEKGGKELIVQTGDSDEDQVMKRLYDWRLALDF